MIIQFVDLWYSLEMSMSPQEKENTRDSIIKQVIEQFSEYDHHNQKLFVQFFSAVLVVLIGYAFVFSNQQFLYSGAEKGNYTLMHLLSVYVVAQIILIFLSTLILNIGYSFRRDQLLLFNIRKSAFPENEYNDIFGTKSNNPLHKGLLRDSYLPTFNALFFRFVILVQTTLLATMIIAQEASAPHYLDFVQNHRFTYVYILAFPLLINLSEYVRFFIKYKSKVDIEPYSYSHINGKFTLIQEGWATLIPLLLLIELLLQGTWKNILVVIVEFLAWIILAIFLVYLIRVLKNESVRKRT